MPGPVRNPTEAFQQLEAIMLRQMLQSSGAFRASDSPGAQLRTDMFVETLAAAVAKAGGLGIAHMLERQLGGADRSDANNPGGTAPRPAAAPTFGGAGADAHIRLPVRRSGGTSAEPVSTRTPARYDGLDDLDDPNSDAPLPEDPDAPSIDDFQSPRPLGTQATPSLGTPPGAAGSVAGTVTSPFGPRIHPITHDRRFHTGVDLRAPQGAPIHAAAGGVVIEAANRGGYGNTVQIDHGNGTSTLYAHASELLVHKGERVESGQTVALVGQTGQATGPHLHFEVRHHDHPVNPASGRAAISLARALNTYRERVEAEEAGTPQGADTGVTP